MKSSATVLRFADSTARAKIACSRCSLGELCLPRGLCAQDIGALEDIVDRSNPMQAGEHVFRAGDPFETITVVRAGCFKSYLVNEEGQEQVLDFALPGEILGLDAIHRGAHVSSCVALDTSAVCSLSFDSLSELARGIPALQSELFSIMSHRIADLETVCGDHSADQRFALFLESLSQRYSRRGYSTQEFTLAMSRRDIASYLRLATETVSRILARMKEDGLLEVSRNRLRILDADALHAIALGGSGKVSESA